jgi:hypothetical protein
VLMSRRGGRVIASVHQTYRVSVDAAAENGDISIPLPALPKTEDRGRRSSSARHETGKIDGKSGIEVKDKRTPVVQVGRRSLRKAVGAPCQDSVRSARAVGKSLMHLSPVRNPPQNY